MRLALGSAAALASAVLCALPFPALAQTHDRDAPRRERETQTFRIPDQVDFSTVERPGRGEAGGRPRVRIGPDPRGFDQSDAIAFGGQTVEARLRGMGVRDGSEFGGRGRLYLFAADGQTAVGYNLTPGGDGWSRGGLSLDDGAFIGDAQAGVAWRSGNTQTSFGYVHREVERENRFGRDRQEGFVALQFSWTPGR